jgi:hypothetical protein
MIAVTVEGPVREVEERSGRKGLWIRLVILSETLLPVNFFTDLAEARLLRIGTVVRADCRVSGTAFRTPDGKVRRGVQLTAETLVQVLPTKGPAGHSGGKPSSATRQERPRQWKDSWGVGA